MKKLIAISVMLVLLTGAAFAQFSGDLLIGTVFLSGGSEEDDISMGGTNYFPGAAGVSSRISATLGGDAGTGRVVYRFQDDSLWGWFAWRPIEMFRVKLGWDRDGEWGTGRINGWGFTEGAKDVVAINDYQGKIYMQARDPWYGGIGDGQGWSLMFSLYPIEGLQINFGLPEFLGPSAADSGPAIAGAHAELSVKLSTFHASATYAIDGIGNVGLAFVGAGGLAKDQEKVASAGTIYASFFLSAIEGMSIDLGFNMAIPFTNASDNSQGGRMGIGFGFSMPQVIENLSFKLRTGFALGGTDAAGESLGLTEFSVGILPCYNLGFMKFYFHAGMGMDLPSEGDSTMGWFINPYISVPAGGITFWAGFQLSQESNQGSDAAKQIRWAVPFGFSAGF